MHRAFVALLAVALSAATLHADPLEAGAFLGPRLFSQHSALGYIEEAPAHPMLQDGIAFGGRVGHEFMVPWFFPELELAVSPTKTNAVGGATAATVVWLDPRIQLRFEILPGRRLVPFALIGGGVPTAISTARKTFATGITEEGYVGIGARYDTLKGFGIRLDARLAVVAGENPPPLGWEGEIDFGIDFGRGGPPRHRPDDKSQAEHVGVDTVGDGSPDAKDQCPTKP